MLQNHSVGNVSEVVMLQNHSALGSDEVVSASQIVKQHFVLCAIPWHESRIRIEVLAPQEFAARTCYPSMCFSCF